MQDIVFMLPHFCLRRGDFLLLFVCFASDVFVPPTLFLVITEVALAGVRSSLLRILKNDCF